MLLLRTSICLIGLAFLITGCGSSSNGTDDQIVRTGPVPATVGSSGKLTSEPGALTLKDIDREGKGSAQAAIFRLWFWGQWGSAPNIVSMYDPKVRSAVGVSNITGAYSQQRDTLVASV